VQIVFVVLVLAAAVLLSLGAALVGGILLTTKRARVLVPVFFLLVPATILGALAGGLLVGYLAVKANQNLLFLGPLAGLILGGVVGLLFGLVGAVFWWWRMSRAADPESRLS
jgi:hypothetical protein